VYLPVNPVEYHGPHLSLHNDHLVSMALAADLHRAIGRDDAWPFIVAASIEAGVEPCPGPGTRPTSFPIVRDLVGRACSALVELGARRVILMTFHGSPLHAVALDHGVRQLEARGVRAVQPLNLLLEMLVKLDARELEHPFAAVEDAEARALVMRELPTDFHAGFFETSVALHYVPETVSPLFRELPPCPEIRPNALAERLSGLARAAGRQRLADELHLVALGLGWTALRPFPGYTGRPSLASARVGERFANMMVERFAECVTNVFNGAPTPRPPMGWLQSATLGGRIPGLSVPTEDVARFQLG
jgi:creatinine amidohydrolase